MKVSYKKQYLGKLKKLMQVDKRVSKQTACVKAVMAKTLDYFIRDLVLLSLSAAKQEATNPEAKSIKVTDEHLLKVISQNPQFAKMKEFTERIVQTERLRKNSISASRKLPKPSKISKTTKKVAKPNPDSTTDSDPPSHPR